MSLFGPADDSDRRRWQQYGLDGLTRLIELGHDQHLPPLTWTLPAGSRVLGRVETLHGHPPRDVYDQWRSALLGECGPPTVESERTPPSGQTCLSAHFGLRLSDHAVEVVLVAEWFAEDLVQAVER